MKYRPTADFYFLKLQPLSATIGTKIKSYGGWTAQPTPPETWKLNSPAGRNLIAFEVRRRDDRGRRLYTRSAFHLLLTTGHPQTADRG
jgi:hypothetical protein